MEGSSGSGLNLVAASVIKKKRSSLVRRPRQCSSFLSGSHNLSLLPSTPSSDNTNKLSPGDSSEYDNSSRRKEIYINTSPSKVDSLSNFDDTVPLRKIKREDRAHQEFYADYVRSNPRDQRHNGSDVEQSSEGVFAPNKWKNSSICKGNSEMVSPSPELYGHNLCHSVEPSSASGVLKLKKVKLKVGGLTRTIPAKSNIENINIESYSAKASRSSDGSRPRQRIIYQESSGGNHFVQEKEYILHGDPWKDVGGASASRNEITEDKLYGRQRDQHHGVSCDLIRKSMRVPKRRVLDGEFDDGTENDELGYIKRPKDSRVSARHTAENDKDEGDGVKKRKHSKIGKVRSTSYEVDEEYNLSRVTKQSRKKSRSGRLPDDTDYAEEDKHVSDADVEEKKNKQKLPAYSSPDVRLEPLTTRRRALQPGKDGNVLSLIEFPDGLPPAPPRKQKQKLSEVEEHAKKAEAAQRRKMQVEKANKESEAAAIRKILGLDSDKKKAEKEKAQAEKAKAAKSQGSEGSCIRWIIGPNGTVVTFPEDVGLPSIFDSKPCSYPPPREKCAGPSCTNPYKYRDSKSNLPLCSLQCYKATQGIANPLTLC